MTAPVVAPICGARDGATAAAKRAANDVSECSADDRAGKWILRYRLLRRQRWRKHQQNAGYQRPRDVRSPCPGRTQAVLPIRDTQSES
jgi:hypothetical protein